MALVGLVERALLMARVSVVLYHTMSSVGLFGTLLVMCSMAHRGCGVVSTSAAAAVNPRSVMWITT